MGENNNVHCAQHAILIVRFDCLFMLLHVVIICFHRINFLSGGKDVTVPGLHASAERQL